MGSESGVLQGAPDCPAGDRQVFTDANGFPLCIQAFEWSKVETKGFFPPMEAFIVTYDLHNATVVADAGMISEANRRYMDAAGLSHVLGGRTKMLPYPIWKWDNVNLRMEYNQELPSRHRKLTAIKAYVNGRLFQDPMVTIAADFRPSGHFGWRVESVCPPDVSCAQCVD